MSNITVKSINRKTTVSRAKIKAAVAAAYAKNSTASEKAAASQIFIRVVMKEPATSAKRVK